MLERTHIQSTGFRNIGPEGARTGFELRIRQANYRSSRLSLIEGVDITVDGVLYPAAHNRFRLGDREYTRSELNEATETRLYVGDYFTVVVPKAGGLTRGVHLVGSAISYRHPYFPPEFQPAIARNERHATIILS
ncbi:MULTISPECIES: DUF6379 domain-containing protein [unclassified Novosphingobium]|uniref:C-glycoside deglycosidase beta subunit domain-containing protein n=1 Tax=unclassified Novosphingobium TaxID=2644732 RepID=UPI00020EFC58|nr:MULTISPECIES: DUF6379 domain-containing protein [unclassified Novosphingobium]GFM29010.1 uncharacterized protein PY1_contig-06-250 [Novosphingobium sp. PY1]CCA90117.1 conserved hypothetical protein [Novosphingobium sp. PP1Y]